MSVGFTGPGGVQSSAPTTPIERPDAASIDPSQITFAGVLAQLFQSVPPTSVQPDLNTVNPPIEAPSDRPAPEREEEPRQASEQVAERNELPEEPADDVQPLPPSRVEPESEGESASAKTEGVVVAPTLPSTTSIAEEPVAAPRTTLTMAEDVIQFAQAVPQDLPAPVAPQAPPARALPPEPQAHVEAPARSPETPTPAPDPSDIPLPPIVRAAEGVLDAQALGAVPAQTPAAAMDASQSDPAAPAGPEGTPVAPRLDIVSASSQVTAAGVAPTGQGAETGLDTRPGPSGSNASQAIAATGGASSGTPAEDLGSAAAPRRVDPGPIIDRVVRGMRLSMKSGQSRMRFLLSPPSLGSVTVDLEVKHGVLSAHIAADSGEARDLLARNITALTDSLRDQGIRVGDVMVSARQDGERGSGAHGQPGGGLPASFGGQAALEDPRSYAEERRRLLSRDQIVDLMA